MEMISEGIIDAGPVIHLEEIESLKLLELIDRKIVTEEVRTEIGLETSSRIDTEVVKLEAGEKDESKYMVEKHGIELGEATSIAVASSRDIECFFTDDLEARKIAKAKGVETHGTLAIVTRSLRSGLIEKPEAKKTVRELYSDSSLFITQNLVEWALEEIENFS